MLFKQNWEMQALKFAFLNYYLYLCTAKNKWKSLNYFNLRYFLILTHYEH